MAVKDELGETIFRRCHFVVKEIRRVGDAVDALERQDFARLGALMLETHDGLSKEYEVSCEELDFLVNALRNDENVLGSRMMGGGFGGCSISLVKKNEVDALIERVGNEYREKFNIALEPYKIEIAEGTTFYTVQHAVI